MALMAASISLPEQSIQALLRTTCQQADSALIVQLLDDAVEASNLPRAVRIARSAHRAGVISCYSGLPAAATAALPDASLLRTLHVAFLPPRLVPCVLLAWLTEIAEHEEAAVQGTGARTSEEQPFVVVTGARAGAEDGRRGSGGSGGVVPSLEMWNVRNQATTTVVRH